MKAFFQILLQIVYKAITSSYYMYTYEPTKSKSISHSELNVFVNVQ